MMITDISEEIELNKAFIVPAILVISKSVLCYLHKKHKYMQNRQTEYSSGILLIFYPILPNYGTF